jgi:flagellar biosynthesis GTPase FlhF
MMIVRTPNDFATAILNDLKKVLDKQFPVEGPQSTTAHREVENQWMLVKHFSSMAAPIYRRTKTLVHNYVNSSAHQPLTLVGEEGAGKTFLLAAIAAEYKRCNPQALVTFNCVGLTRDSYATGIMLGVMTQIRYVYSLTGLLFRHFY